MEQMFNRYFKSLALLARGIGLFPFFIIFSYLYSKQYNEALFSVQLVGLLAVIMMGYIQVEFQAYLQERLEGKVWLERIIMGTLYILEVGLIINGILNYFQADTIMKIITVVIYIVLYGMSIRAYEQHYTRIMTIELIVIISVCYIIAMALSKYSPLGIMYLLVIASYIFLNNQQRLEQLLRSTQENTPMFKNIRRDNMKWVILIMGAILIVYPARKYIENILWWLWQKILSVILFIAYIIVKILSLLGSDETKTEGAAEQGGMGYMPPPEKNEWLDMIFWILVISVTIYVCIKKRKVIFKVIGKTFSKIQAIIVKGYQFLFSKKQKDSVYETYYEDTIEELSEIDMMQIQGIEKTTKKKWIKQVKKYLKSASEMSQYREGYKLLLQGLHIKGIEIQGSYTPREIMESASHMEDIPSIEAETQQYEAVRYDEQLANIESIDILKQTLQEMLVINR